METIESPLIDIKANTASVFAFLSDCTKHKLLMPDGIENFTADADTCSFTIKGTGNLALKVEEKVPNSLIKLLPTGKVPFSFEFLWVVEPDGENSKVQNKIIAKMNPFIKALAYKPLKNFISEQALNLQKYYNNQ
ncbi:MAG: hypothetical protein SGJ10_10720 [Bacteroidota bacterium]|nr:hypothetical protein [Bacteroidota bacterium]